MLKINTPQTQNEDDPGINWLTKRRDCANNQFFELELLLIRCRC